MMAARISDGLRQRLEVRTLDAWVLTVGSPPRPGGLFSSL